MKKYGPWKIKSSKIKYSNPWITVREDKVIQPHGNNGIFGVVKMNPGVSVLPLDNKGFVYLTKEFHYAIGRQGIEVVSGAVEKNESKIKAAKRELQEELGIVAKKWTDLGNMDPFTTVINSPAQLFLARNLKFTTYNQEGTEKIKIVKLKLAQAVKMVMNGKITHGQSSVLILKAWIYLKQL